MTVLDGNAGTKAHSLSLDGVASGAESENVKTTQPIHSREQTQENCRNLELEP